MIHQEKTESPRSHVLACRCKAIVFRSTSKSPTRRNVEAFVGKKPKESVDNVNAAALVNSDGNEIAPEVVRILFYQLRR